MKVLRNEDRDERLEKTEEEFTEEYEAGVGNSR